MNIEQKDLNKMKTLAKIAYTGKVPHKTAMEFAENNVTLTQEMADGLLREKFAELAPNRKSFRRNQVAIFELIEETIDEVLPARMNEAFDAFAQFKQFNNGDKAVFKMPKGKTQIRRFIQRIALGVPMKKARLDKDVATMDFFALGGGVRVEWETYLDGQSSFVELCDLIVEELMNAVYDELIEALNKTVEDEIFKKVVKQTTATFSVQGMAELISYASSYGNGGATIVCSPAFASGIREESGFISDSDKNDMRERGYIGKFRGADVVVIPQKHDENGVGIFDEKIAFVFPSGNREEDKFIKIGFEGETQIRDGKGDDWALEYEVYKKMGVLVSSNLGGIGLYKITV